MAKKRITKPTEATADGMKINKSAAVREYLKGNKQAKPKEIVAALKERGVDVSPNMVSMIRTNRRSSERFEKRRRRRPRIPRTQERS